MSEVKVSNKNGKKKITKKDITRWICIILVALMVLSVLPLTIFMI